MNLVRKLHTFVGLARQRNWPELAWRARQHLHLIPDAERSARFWDTFEDHPGQHWSHLSLVRHRWRTFVTGDPAKPIEEYVADKYFAGRQPRSALVLACGTGNWADDWLPFYRFETVHGIDVSPSSVELARQRARVLPIANVTYEVADLNTVGLPSETYDVVLANAAIHHVKNLEHLFGEVRKTLRPGGLFVMDEFVGPSRFQWTDRQLEVMNGLLAILPHRYRASCSQSGEQKPSVERPDLRVMIDTDPSEAARSGEIEELVRKHFDVIEWKGAGGAILHMLMYDIAGNFREDLAEDRAWLQLCFTAEDLVMASGDVQSDFVLAVCLTGV